MVDPIHRRLLQPILRTAVRLVIENPASRKGIDRLIEELEKSTSKIEKRVAASRGRPQDIQILGHVIGIERWGQRRLRVALGEPLQMDEHDLYLQDSKDWDELRQVFISVRRETISLGKTLRMAGVDTQILIPHNELGNLSLLGWLRYLNLHANFESSRMN